ncbi:hypothetical protein [Sphingobium sp.]|jgi:hypothetical protein|uniref:hypothetical protein n=1 Tax=Sphingobium sp. TaxID=1912891 RepID=UPI00257B4E36|nr:hypothetical protein [Sphingobium sp.]
MCNPDPQPYHSNHRYNDPKIEDESRLLRHCRTPVQIVSCEINGKKISDRAFAGKKSEAGLSVDLNCLLEKDGKGSSHRFGKLPNTYAILSVTAAEARANSAGVAYTPKPEEPELEGAAREANPYHGEIIHPMTGAQARALFRASTTVHSIL